MKKPRRSKATLTPVPNTVAISFPGGHIVIADPGVLRAVEDDVAARIGAWIRCACPTSVRKDFVDAIVRGDWREVPPPRPPAKPAKEKHNRP